MNRTGFGQITVVATGAAVTTSVASAGTTIPLASSTEVPRFIRVNASSPCYFRMGAGAQTAIATDLMVTNSVVLVVPRGFNNWAALQVAAAGVCQVSPLEDV